MLIGVQSLLLFLSAGSFSGACITDCLFVCETALVISTAVAIETLVVVYFSISTFDVVPFTTLYCWWLGWWFYSVLVENPGRDWHRWVLGQVVGWTSAIVFVSWWRIVPFWGGTLRWTIGSVLASSASSHIYILALFYLLFVHLVYQYTPLDTNSWIRPCPETIASLLSDVFFAQDERGHPWVWW